MLSHNKDELSRVIKTLADVLWEQRVSDGSIQAWLANFRDEQERDLALHLLAHFAYFGNREVREMLKALFRDFVRYPVVQKIRAENGNTTDQRVIEPLFDQSMKRTRFLGIGNPSESGTHLLYYFRQENELPKNLFLSSHRIFRSRGDRRRGPPKLREPSVRRYVFIDDICGSGTQAKQYSEDIVEKIQAEDATVAVEYYCLFGTEVGLKSVRDATRFTEVRSLFTLDESFKCFAPESRYYLKPEQRARIAAKRAFAAHGAKLCPTHPLGYKDGQLLLGFFHNVPDNVLPIIWAERMNWTPIFRRYPKVEGWL